MLVDRKTNNKHFNTLVYTCAQTSENSPPPPQPHQSDLCVQQRQTRQVLKQTVEERRFAQELHVKLVHEPHAVTTKEIIQKSKWARQRMRPLVKFKEQNLME